jgi:hypothetical protein
MHRHVFRLLAGGVLFASLSAQLCHASMSTQGQFAVGESGAATYNIPLMAPPGTAGIAPKLSLSYNSQAGNGLLGVGWSLSGLSSIGRCPKTFPQDGERGVVSYNDSDRFCLDGQRLLAVSGTYGAAGTEYRTERESFTKIVSYGSIDNGPAWFKVWTKSGQVMEYGNTSDSRIEAQGKTTPAAWGLNKLSDTKGNYLAVTYTENNANGEFYPQRIDYTGNANTSTAPNASVQFTYESRTDIVSRYRAGSLYKTTVRLANVKTYVGTNLVKDYRLVYGTAPSTLRSRLQSLTECPASGSCLPAMTFGWQDLGSSTLTSASQWTGSFGIAAGYTNSATYPRFAIDINGDGKADMAAFGSTGVAVALNTGAGFATSSAWSSEFGTNGGWTDTNTYPRHFADVNGDGLPDIVAFGPANVKVALNTGSSFATSTIWNTNAFGPDTGWTADDTHPRFLMDMNGDGRADIAGFGTNGVMVALSTGTSFSTATMWTSSFGTAAGYTNTGTYPRYFADVNGDGLPDLVAIGAGGVKVALNTGSAFGTSSLWIGGFGTDAGWTNTSTYPRYLTDVNGDGMADVVGFGSSGVSVALSNGTAFGASSQWIGGYGTDAGYYDAGAYPRYIVDVNGDGLADVLAFGHAAIKVSLNTGSGFSAAATLVNGYGYGDGFTSNYEFPRYLADFNGDGLLDVAASAGSGVLVSTSGTSATPDLIVQINNGLTTVVTLQYKPLTDSTLYSKDSGGDAATYPVQDLRYAQYVVSSVASFNGVGGTTTANYTYGGLKVDWAGRGLLGFRWQQAVQVETGVTAYTEFRQDWPYTGLMAVSKKTLSGAGSSGLLSRVVNTYGCTDFVSGSGCTVATGRRYFPYVSQSVETGYDLNGAALPTITTTSHYDSYGNPTQIVVGTGDGYSKTTTNTYVNDTTNWFLGRLTRATVTSTTP